MSWGDNEPVSESVSDEWGKVTSRNAKHLWIIKHRRRRETPWHRIKKTLAETKKLGEVGGAWRSWRGSQPCESVSSCIIMHPETGS